ncbi:MAG: murein biosynthesis integral membrane protein MurJ [Planctomycetota bacterium]|nr:murein biosynthesis integral membrane protein MurJ [Planctomycetota bacterium]
MAGNEADAAAPKKRSRSFLRSLGTVTGITLISRCLGLVRDILMASIFGLTLYADAFYVAWTLPNLFRRLCGEGALSSAFLPVFVDVKKNKGVDKAQSLTNGTVTRLALILALLVLVMELVLSSVWFFDGLLNSEMAHSILLLSQILLPYLWFICIAGLLSGLLHSEGDFARPAGMAVLLNLVWIAALLVTGESFLFGEGFHWGPEERVLALAGALVLGGAMQLALQVWGCSSVGFPIRPSLQLGEDYKRVKALYIPIAFGMAIEQLNIFADRGIAWLCVESAGGVAALYYSMRLIQLPIALIGTALATVLFPAFAKLAASGQGDLLRDHLKKALRITVFITLPAAVGLCIMSEEIISLLFERGRFGAEESARTAFCLVCYGVSVVMISLSATQIRAYHARQDSQTPVRVGVIAVILNFVLNLILVQVMEEAGLALATSLAASFSFFTLLWKDKGDFAGFSMAMLRCSALSAVMAVACLATLSALPNSSGPLIRVVVPVAVSVLVYGGLAYILKVPEWKQALLLKQGADG